MASQLRRGALVSYAAVAFNALAGLLYTPWMVSSIGSGDYGLYTLAISVVNFFMMDFGLGSAVSRFLSRYYARGQAEEANRFLGVAYRIYAAISAAVLAALVVVYLFVGEIYAGLTPSQLETFKGLYLVVAGYSVVAFPFASLDGVLVSNERFVALNLCSLIQKVATVALIVAALLLGAGVFALVAVNALVGLASVAAKLALVARLTPARPRLRFWDRSAAREVFGFSAWVTVAQVCQRFVFSVMPSVLAAVSGAWEIALFGLASSIEGYVYTVANALNGMFMPKVSRVLAGEDPSAGLQALAVRVGRVQLFIVGFIFVAFACLGNLFATCWMGEGYGALYPCVLLLILPSVVELPQLAVGTAVVAAGEVRAKAAVFCLMAVVSMGLGVGLGGPFGALGACAAICVAYLVRTFGMDAVYSRRLGFRVARFFKDAYARWLVPASATFAFGLALDALLPLFGWVGFAVKLLAVFAVYACLLWALCMDDYEKGLVSSVLGPLARRMGLRGR